LATLSAALAFVVLIASVIAVVLVTRSKRVETALKVIGESVDTISTANRELRDMIEQRAVQYAANRLADKQACDEALAAEREARQADNLACAKDIATLQGKVDVLTGDMGDMIATAVLRTIAQTSGQTTSDTATVATTVATTTTRPANQGDT
jgi:hypothetical protein